MDISGFTQLIRAHLRCRAAAYVVLGISLAAALIVYGRVCHNVSEREQARFTSLVRAAREVVQSSIDRCADELFAVRGLFEASALVRTNEWEQFIASLDVSRRHPGLRSISFAELVPANQRESFERRVRRELYPEFKIVRRNDPPISLFTTYAAQFPPSADRPIGWDSYGDSPRRAALDYVLTNGTAATTAKNSLANSATGSVVGFVMVVPVYRAQKGLTNLHGAVLGEFAPQQMLAALARRQLDSRVHVELFDTGEPEQGRLLGATSGSDDRRSTFSHVQSVRVFNRTLTLRVSSNALFDAASERYVPKLVLVGGLVLSFLLFRITWTQVSGRAAAEGMSQRLLASKEQLRAANEELEQKIAERKLAEDELEKEKELLAVTLRSIADGVITTDIEGRIVLFNKVAEHLTGWKQPEAVNQSLREVFQTMSPQGESTDTELLRRAVQNGQVIAQDQSNVLIARDGTERNISQTIAPIVDHGGKIVGAVFVFRDITEKLKTDAELLKISKLESVGLLAGGIAHDFNNILTVILGNISLARMSDESGRGVTHSLGEAEKASLRARELTQRLLTFAKGGAPIKKTLQLASMISDCTNLTLRGSDVTYRVLISDDLWSVEADESQLSQVLQNLFTYARSTMAKDPKLDVHAINQELSSDPLMFLKPGKYVRVSIRDYSGGLQPEHLNKIFDPYFTPKRSGSGLELATAYSIVRKHEGQIRVESISGQGTVFHIYLPATETSALSPQIETLPSVGEVPSGRVLVMDDEPGIRALAEAFLQRMGCTVEVACDGAEAVDLYMSAKRRGENFDLVIMDLTVPNGIGGKETIQRLRALDPEVKAIVSSGYSNDPVMANYREHGFCGVVPKPYGMHELESALADVLGTTSRAIPETRT